MNMPDLEKVIRGLECCANTTPTYCRECPYKGTPDDYPRCIYERLVVDALALLREQEPVEPIRKRETGTQRCGICRTFICSPPNRFCPNCGRKVKRDV